ncbi:MAG: CYTH domain-containing protein, partial [Candidatus Nanoarchaeia archaeon]
MREVEGKILEIDREVVIKKLEALGAKKIFEGELRAFYYDFPDGSIRKRHHHARLRKENDKVFLVYKVKDQT